MGNQNQRPKGKDEEGDGAAAAAVDGGDDQQQQRAKRRRRRRNDNTLQGPSDILTEEEIVDIQVIKGAVVGVKEV